jgi:hypothetical protein
MEQFLNLENKKFHTVGTVPNWNCSNSVVLFVFLDFGTVPTMWYYLFI